MRILRLNHTSDSHSLPHTLSNFLAPTHTGSTAEAPQLKLVVQLLGREAISSTVAQWHGVQWWCGGVVPVESQSGQHQHVASHVQQAPTPHAHHNRTLLALPLWAYDNNNTLSCSIQQVNGWMNG